MGRTRTRAAAGLVLDAGALIALNRGDKRMTAAARQALRRQAGLAAVARWER
jgi:hypothetical protein